MRAKAAAAVQWGDLTDDHAGQQVRLTFWWEPEPVVAEFVSRGYHDGYAPADPEDPDAGQVQTWVHVLRYDVHGEQSTALPVTHPVDLL